ncbi:MAG TPA: site-2 protease family protein [Aeromicrobium sp.]|nr:site-2 protease family protein [Aeromicrobium sp.]
MAAGNLRIARLAGVEVLVGPSLLLMGGLLIFLFAPRFDSDGATSGYVGALLFVLGLYVSVFLHEAAHLVAAKSFGLRVRSITLHILGGETAIEGSGRTPTQEFVISVVGPLVSLGIGAACLLGHSGNTVVFAIGWINIVVGVFNLLPGLPLDGGRALRALIWRVSGRLDVGTRVAGWGGRLIAVALVVVTLLRLDFDGPTWSVDLAFAVLVAWFLWEGASHALSAARR